MKFALFYTEMSPFSRLVRAQITRLGLSNEVTLIRVNPYQMKDSLKEINPLGKIPILAYRDDNNSLKFLAESQDICDFLMDYYNNRYSIKLSSHAQGEKKQIHTLLIDAISMSVAYAKESRLKAEPDKSTLLQLQADLRKALVSYCRFALEHPSITIDLTMNIALISLLDYIGERVRNVVWETSSFFRQAHRVGSATAPLSETAPEQIAVATEFNGTVAQIENLVTEKLSDISKEKSAALILSNRR